MNSRLTTRVRALEERGDGDEEWRGEGLSALLAYAKRKGLSAGAMPPDDDEPPTGLSLLLRMAGEEGP